MKTTICSKRINERINWLCKIRSHESRRPRITFSKSILRESPVAVIWKWSTIRGPYQNCQIFSNQEDRKEFQEAIVTHIPVLTDSYLPHSDHHHHRRRRSQSSIGQLRLRDADLAAVLHQTTICKQSPVKSIFPKINSWFMPTCRITL